MTGILPSSGVTAENASNSLANPPLAAGCENLWYSTQRCNPRFDPSAANATIAELLNVIACGSNTYDCTRLDNLCLAIRDLIKDVLHDCQDREYPDSSSSCQIEQLVLATDSNGCKRISRYSSSSSVVGTLSGYPLFGPNASAVVPSNPEIPASYYNVVDLNADATSHNVQMSKVLSNRILSGVVTVICDAQVEIEIGATNFFGPAINGGNGAQSRLAVLVDGQVYLGANGPVTGAYFTNYSSAIDNSITINLTAGAHSVEIFVIAEGNLPPAQVGITTGNNSIGGSGGATARVRPF